MADNLGSTRLVMGATTERHDYSPFGVDLYGAGSLRTSGNGYTVSPGVPLLFTGQEYDAPNRLYHFPARFMNPDQGRFISPDPANAGASLTDPQSWNGYGYVSNNPLRFTGPSGLGLGWLKWVGAAASAVGAVFTGGASAILGFESAGTAAASTTGTVLLIGGSALELGGVIADNVGGVGISGNPDAWWSGCGFLYGTVCGVAPESWFHSAATFSVTHEERLARLESGPPVTAENVAPGHKNSCVSDALTAAAWEIGIDASGLIPAGGGANTVARKIGNSFRYRGIVAPALGKHPSNSFNLEQTLFHLPRGLPGRIGFRLAFPLSDLYPY